MTQEHEHDRDAPRLKAMLRSVDTDAPSPDAGVLRQLRQRAADEFDRAKPDSASLGPCALFNDDGTLTPVGEAYRSA